jgi:hypothetical protein
MRDRVKRPLKRLDVNLASASTSGSGKLEAQNAKKLGLRGRLLLLARIVCIVVDVLALGLFVVTFPTYFGLLRTPCTPHSCITGQLSVSNSHALLTFGLSLNSYAILGTILVVIAVLPCIVIATLLLWRKAANWTALLVAVMLVGLGTSYSLAEGPVLRPLLGPMLSAPVSGLFNYLGAVALPLIISLLPNGRFVPRWTRWLVLAQLLVGVIFMLPLSSVPFSDVASFFSSLAWGSCLLILVGAQIYRYRHVSTPVERQQTKWIIFGFSVALLITLTLLLPLLFIPALRQADSPYYSIWSMITSFLLTLPITLCFGLAILRYRLYNIDVIINHTLVYATLTATLGLIYFGLVFAFQSLVHALTGETGDNPLVIVGSTLVIAALFTPLRRQIQAIIDRRFYRSKYDAERTLAAFSTNLRHEMNLAQLSEQLVTVIQETMQPEHISLWLRSTEQDRKRQTS